MESTLDKIKAIIQDNINQDAVNVQVYNDAAKAIAKFQGKKPSKLIANTLAKEHPEYTVSWRAEYGMYHLEIWGITINRDFNNRISLLIAYDSNPIVDMAGYAKHSIAYGEAAQERNNKRRALLADSQELARIAQAIDGLNKSIDKYVSLVDYPNPDSYYFDRLIKDSRVSKQR